VINSRDFAVSLCATAHDSIGGRSFKNMEEWYTYLLKVSQGEAEIITKKILSKDHLILKRVRTNK